MAAVSRVVIIGAGGHVGGAIARELVKRNQHIITALTRQGSTTELPDGVHRVEIDYANHALLVDSLRGQQFLIITLSITAPPTLHADILKAAAEAGVPHIMPNLFGADVENPAIMNETLNGKTYKQRFAELALVDCSWTVLVCGFWYEFSLALGPAAFGFDIPGRVVTLYDDGNTKIDVSTWDQCGRAVAGLLCLPEKGANPCLADWKNRPLYLNSFNISQRDMLASLNRVLGLTDADWKFESEPSDLRVKRGMEALQKGDRTGFPLASYARIFYPSGDGDYGSKRGLANEMLGLPQEALDHATKRAVDMVQMGWSPFG